MWNDNMMHAKEKRDSTTQTITTNDYQDIKVQDHTSVISNVRKNESEIIDSQMCNKMLMYDLCVTQADNIGTLYECINRDYEVKNEYDFQQSYKQFKRNLSNDRSESGTVFVVGMAIMGTIHAYKHMDDDELLLHLLLTMSKATVSLD